MTGDGEPSAWAAQSFRNGKKLIAFELVPQQAPKSRFEKLAEFRCHSTSSGRFLIFFIDPLLFSAFSRETEALPDFEEFSVTSDSGATSIPACFLLSFVTDYSKSHAFMSFADVLINLAEAQQIRMMRIGAHDEFSRATKSFSGSFFFKTRLLYTISLDSYQFFPFLPHGEAAL